MVNWWLSITKIGNVFLITLLLLISVNINAEMPKLPSGISSHDSVSSEPHYAPNTLLVKFEDSTVESATQISIAHASIGATVMRDYGAEGATGLQLISLPKNMSVQDAITYYTSNPGVVYAEPDYYRYEDKVPDDLDFWRQWGSIKYRTNIQGGESSWDNWG